MSYDKLSGPTPRIMILESRYWLDSACRNAAIDLGWEVEIVPIVAEGVMPRENIEHLLGTLIDFRPDFILSVNLGGMDEEGLFARLFEDLHVPYIGWFVDDPRTILMGRSVYTSDYTVALTWEQSYEEYLSDIGFPVVHTLPLAVDPTIFDSGPSDNCDLPPTFVGNSMESFADREWAWISENTNVAEEVQEAFDTGRITRETFAQGLESMLDKCVLDELDIHDKRHVEMLFFIEGTRRLRHGLVSTLEPDGIKVRGDEGWAKSFSCADGPINYEHDLPIFYRQCKVNLNTTSIQMKTTVNQRVFDCPAAGGFLLTDSQSALEDFFDVEGEIACYNSFEECRDLIHFYQDNSKARIKIINNARKRILAEHTYTHRLETIKELIRERYC